MTTAMTNKTTTPSNNNNNIINTDSNSTMSITSSTNKSFVVNDASQDIPIFLRSKYF